MDDSLIRFFAPHTQEEESLLRGEPLAQGRYTDRSAFIVEGERFVPSRQMISLRPHTRFADFPMHWHDYVEMMYMLQGETLHGMPDGSTVRLQAGELLLGLPNTIISHTMLSPKYKVRLAGFSTRFLQRIIKMEKETWNTAIHIHNNPVKSVDNGEDQTVFGFYRDLIIAKINDEPHCYHKEVIQHLFSAIFCEMMGQLHKEIEASGNMEGSKEGIKQVNYILRKFMELLSKDKGMHRSVSYFANELCYTPKHFSKVIKQACGRTPLDLINETTVEHIKYRLKRSEKSIKEIAEEFNFPNQSFFGKYVKAHLGTSPANYRNRKEE